MVVMRRPCASKIETEAPALTPCPRPRAGSSPIGGVRRFDPRGPADASPTAHPVATIGRWRPCLHRPRRRRRASVRAGATCSGRWPRARRRDRRGVPALPGPQPRGRFRREARHGGRGDHLGRHARPGARRLVRRGTPCLAVRVRHRRRPLRPRRRAPRRRGAERPRGALPRRRVVALATWACAATSRWPCAAPTAAASGTSASSRRARAAGDAARARGPAIFASRASAELERRRHQAALRERELEVVASRARHAGRRRGAPAHRARPPRRRPAAARALGLLGLARRKAGDLPASRGRAPRRRGRAGPAGLGRAARARPRPAPRRPQRARPARRARGAGRALAARVHPPRCPSAGCPSRSS